MSKIGLWKSIFGHKEEVLVNVGGKSEKMTTTQSFRFDQLKKSQNSKVQPDYRNPLADAHYSLEDAAFRLMISEDELLKKAVVSNVRLYIDVANVAGRWRRRACNGEITQSSVVTINSGLLRLRTRSCSELHDNGRTKAKVLDYCEAAAKTDARLDNETLAALLAWGPGDKQFFPEEPIIVDRGMVILLPPLG